MIHLNQPYSQRYIYRQEFFIFAYKRTSLFILVALFLSVLNIATAGSVSDTALKNLTPPLKPTFLAVKRPLTIAINTDIPPYYFIDEQGAIAGMMPDLWRLWAKKQQVDIAFVVLSTWSETLNQVVLGNIDIQGGLAIVNSRRKTLAFSQPLFSKYSNIYVNRSLDSVNSLDDLKPYNIGVVTGSVEIESLNKSYPTLFLKEYANRHDLYRAALNNEVLIFTALGGNLVDNFTGYEALRNSFPMHKKLRFQRREFGAAVAKANTDLLAYIDEGFDKISTKERANIESKWLTLGKRKDSLLIAFSSDYAPYMAISPLGEAQGLLIDAWRLWSKHTGIKVEFLAQGIYKAEDLVAEQKADVLLAFPTNMKLPENMTNAKPIYIANSRVYINNKITDRDGKKISSLVQLSREVEQPIIGLWQGSSLKKQFSAQFPQLKVRFFNKLETMLRATEQGEISGFFGFSDIIDAKLVKRNLQNSFYSLNLPVMHTELAPVIQIQNKKLLQTINDGFNQLDINNLVELETSWLSGDLSEAYYHIQATKVFLNDAEQAFIKSHGKINLGIVKNLSPVEFMTNKDEFSGINQEIIKFISERTDLEFNVIAFDSWPALYNALITKEIDVLGNIMATEKRKQDILFTDSYWQMPWVIIHPLYDNRQITLESFYGKEVAIVKGRNLIDKLRKEYPLVTFKFVANREQGLTALKQGRVDGFITTIASGTYLLKQEDRVNFMMSIMRDVSVEKSHLGINKQLPLLKDIMNKGLSTITDAEKQTIYDNWFTLEIKTGLDKDVVFKRAGQIGAVILLVLGIVLLWNRRLQAEIKQQVQLEKKMQHMATHDELTGLANRVLLKDRLTTAINLHHRQSLEMAVLFIDLDGFKDINDNHGHDIGDELLKQVALRLLGCVRSSDTVVRFGGDEFVLLLTGLENASQAANVADKVLTLIQEEFELSKVRAFIGCSIGIAMYPADGDNDIELLKVADTLMYKVKALGKNHYRFN
ncbi:MAG: transporter substrate-binding domain-containing protein [Colwellia sp.]